MMRYDTHAKEKSLYNTPPMLQYLYCRSGFQWIEDMGGIKAIEAINKEKAKILYDFFDESKMFINPCY